MKYSSRQVHSGWEFSGRIDKGSSTWPGSLLDLAGDLNPLELGKITVIKSTGLPKKREITAEQLLSDLSQVESWPYQVVWVAGPVVVRGRESSVEWVLSETAVSVVWSGGWAEDGLIEPVAAHLLDQLISALHGELDRNHPLGVKPVLDARSRPSDWLGDGNPPTRMSLAWPGANAGAGPGPFPDWSWINKHDPADDLVEHVRQRWHDLYESSPHDYSRNAFSVPLWTNELIDAGHDRRKVAVYWGGTADLGSAPPGWTFSDCETMTGGGFAVLRSDRIYGLADQQAGDVLHAWFERVCSQQTVGLRWAAVSPHSDPTLQHPHTLAALGPDSRFPSVPLWLTAVRDVDWQSETIDCADLVVLRHGVGPYPERSRLDESFRAHGFKGSSAPELFRLDGLARLTVPNTHVTADAAALLEPGEARFSVDPDGIEFVALLPDLTTQVLPGLRFTDLLWLLSDGELTALARGRFDPSCLPWAEWHMPGRLTSGQIEAARQIAGATGDLPLGSKILGRSVAE